MIIKNLKVNKKIAKRIASGALALTLVTGLSGCNGFRYSSDSNDNIVVAGSVDNLNNYYLVHVFNNIINSDELYICGKTTKGISDSNYYFYDVFTGNILVNSDKKYEENDFLTILDELPLINYVISYDKVKSKYTIDDLEELLFIIRENYVYEVGHEFVKSR